jgi:phage terminase large subunit-like protein
MVSNVAMDMDAAGNIKPNKAKSGNKIDGVVASIMALAMSIPKEEQNTFNIRFL